MDWSLPRLQQIIRELIRFHEDTVTHGGGAHPDLATHDTLGLATQAELDAHAAAGDPHTGYVLESAYVAGHVIEDEGTPVTQRANMNFTGAGVAVTDAGGKTVVTIAGGGGGLTLTSHTQNLGADPADSGTFDITGLSGLTAGKQVLVCDRTQDDEAEMDQVVATGYVVDSSTIRVYWQAVPGPVSGSRDFGYAVSA